MNREAFLLLMICAECLLLAGCWNGEANLVDGPKELYQDKIIIGTETWPGYLALYVAEDKGFFEEAGLNVEIRRYVALGKLSSDYLAGKMQGRANLTLDALNEHLNGLDHRVVLVIDYSGGADAIAASPGINSVKDFAGKRVGYEPGTLEEFFLNWALRENGLTLDDIRPVHGDPKKSAEMLLGGEVDVAVTHEPFLAKLIATGKAHVVYSSAAAPGLITDILTLRADFVREHPESVKAIVQTYFQSLEFCQQYPHEAHEILAREFGISADEISEQLKGVELLDLRENQDAFSFASGMRSLYGNMRQIHKFVQETRGERNPQQLIGADKMIEPLFIRELSLEK